MRIAVVFLLSLMTGCAILPTTRTFYEPNVEDGTPSNRRSCGYVNTRDSIRRDLDDVRIQVSPGEENIAASDEGELKTYMVFAPSKGAVKLDTSKITVTTETGAIYKAAELRVGGWSEGRGNARRSITSVDLMYPTPAGKSERLTYIFEPGSVIVGDKAISVRPFRFNRVTKGDLFYGSINC